MAGSYRHITDCDNKFVDVDRIDNLGDAREALEECYLMIQYLTGGDKEKIYEAYVEGVYRRLHPGEPLPHWMTSSDGIETYWED